MLSRFIFIGFQKSEKHEDQDFNETLEKTKSKSPAEKPAESPTKSNSSRHKTSSAHTPSKSQPSVGSKQSPATVIKEKKSKSTTPKTKDKYNALPLSDGEPKKAEKQDSATPRSKARKLQEETPDQAEATPSKKTRAETPSKKSSSQTSTRSGGVRSVTPSNRSPEDTKACKTKTKKIEKQNGSANSPKVDVTDTSKSKKSSKEATPKKTQTESPSKSSKVRNYHGDWQVFSAFAVVMFWYCFSLHFYCYGHDDVATLLDLQCWSSQAFHSYIYENATNSLLPYVFCNSITVNNINKR